LSIFQLPAVKLLEVLTHYANTGKKTLSPFIDSSVDNVLLQINPGSTSHEVAQCIVNLHCSAVTRPVERVE